MSTKVAVLASGRGSNFQAIVDAQNQGRLEAEVKVLVSDTEQAQVLFRAEQAGIDNYYINPAEYESKQDFEQRLLQLFKKYKIDLVAMAGFMRLLSPYFISHYRHQIMNIHPSLLPAFKGLNAQQQALDYGVKVTGCTVHFADEGMDTGPIIIQRPVEVKQGDTVESLAERIRQEEHKIYPQAIKLFAEKKLEVKAGTVKIKN